MRKMQDEGDQFVPMSLATVEAFGRQSRPFLVVVYMLHIAQTTKSLSFPFPSTWLRERGVSREDRAPCSAPTGSRWRDLSRMVADRR